MTEDEKKLFHSLIANSYKENSDSDSKRMDDATVEKLMRKEAEAQKAAMAKAKHDDEDEGDGANDAFDHRSAMMIEDEKYADEEAEDEANRHPYKNADIHSVEDAERIMGDDLPEIVRTLNDQQKFALNEMLSGANVFLTGEAGTGKSYVTRAFVELCNLLGKNLVVTASTGIAAINVGGATLHRTFGIPTHPILDPHFRYNASKVVRAADIILIDEISMCREDVFDYVACQLFGLENNDPKHKHRQLIVIGDFFQLPPVVKREDADTLRLSPRFENTEKFFAFESQYWRDFDFHCVSLKKIMRQDDPQFIELLNKARIGDASCVTPFNRACGNRPANPQAITLVGTNPMVDQINSERFAAMEGEVSVYNAVYDGDFHESDCLAEKQLRLKPGARVMALANDIPLDRYQNGSLGYVVSCGSDSVLVQFDNGCLVDVGKFQWKKEAYVVIDKFDENNNRTQELQLTLTGTCDQIPLRLAYAITIHKSQGQTFDCINLQPNAFDVGQLYVALSRVRTLNGLILLTPMNANSLKCSPEVIAFYRDVVDMQNKIHAESATSLVQNLGSYFLSLPQTEVSKLPPIVQYKIKGIRARLMRTEGGRAYALNSADYLTQTAESAEHRDVDVSDSEPETVSAPDASVPKLPDSVSLPN